jgi:hypothetical protein
MLMVRDEFCRCTNSRTRAVSIAGMEKEEVEEDVALLL